MGLQALLPRRSRRVNPHQRGISYGSKQGAFRSLPCTPSGSRRVKPVPIPIPIQKETAFRSLF